MLWSIREDLDLFGIFLPRSFHALFSLCVICFCLGCDIHYPYLDEQAQWLRGDEVRMLVQTHHGRAYYHAQHDELDVRGWLVIAKLSEQVSSADHLRVIGPLWYYRGGHYFYDALAPSHPSYEEITATRRACFDTEGNLVRVRKLVGDGSLVIERLVIGADRAAWQFDGRYSNSVDLRHVYPGVHSHNLKWLLRQSEGKVEVFDAFSGRRIDDPWLERVYGEFRKEKSDEDASVWLSDDRNFLIVFPRLSHFEFAEIKIDERKYALVWPRPETSPTRVASEEPPNADDQYPPRRHPATIEGRLYFVCKHAGQIKLVPFRDGPQWSLDRRQGVDWSDGIDEVVGGDLIIAKGGFFTNEGRIEFKDDFYRWNFVTGDFVHRQLQVTDGFRESGDFNYVPLHATPVVDFSEFSRDLRKLN